MKYYHQSLGSHFQFLNTLFHFLSLGRFGGKTFSY